MQRAQSQRPGWGSVLCQAAGLWFVNGLHSWECEWGWVGVINSLLQKDPSQNIYRTLYRLDFQGVPSPFISSYFSRDV